MAYYQRHLFFCTNVRDEGAERPSCGRCGTAELRAYAKARVKALGLAGEGRVRVNSAGCLDRCAEGPVAVLKIVSVFVLGGDVIRGFVFAMIWGVTIGTYSSIFVASAVLLYLGVKRDWSKPDANAGNQYANIDA